MPASWFGPVQQFKQCIHQMNSHIVVKEKEMVRYKTPEILECVKQVCFAVFFHQQCFLT